VKSLTVRTALPARLLTAVLSPTNVAVSVYIPTIKSIVVLMEESIRMRSLSFQEHIESINTLILNKRRDTLLGSISSLEGQSILIIQPSQLN
jgi:hypothetical protein